MPEHSIHKAADLAVDERSVVERWLGRPLSDDETICVNVYHETCAKVWDQVLEQAREIGSHFEGAGKKELDALLDEAFASVRGRRG